MSNIFKNKIFLSDILEEIGVEVDFKPDFSIVSISDSESSEPFSICDYIKGPLPENKEGLVLLTSGKVDGYNCIIVTSPQETLVKLIEYVKNGVTFKQLYSNSSIPKSVSIGQNVVIEENVEIGEGTTIEHNVAIHSGTKIGENCIIRSNSSIGGQGYGFYTNSQGHLINFPSLGGVELGDNVEVGYNCAIVKGTINNTYLADFVKLDNLVHIAHDCKIGAHATITAGVIFCGYVTVGVRTRIAPQVTIKQRLKIGCDALVGLGAVVTKDVADNTVVAGNPARKLRCKS